uniref:Mannose-1-phosphate guanyltransferase n=1 Tax=Lygus hesperus TaxID=30085 RepID=A0A146KV30_LYGHE
MKAVFLVGGFGIRLRPFTFTKLKPLVSLANIPIIEHQIASLAQAGVKEVILCVGYLPAQLEQAKQGLEEKYNITVHISQEAVPLGTAGPLSLCADILLSDPEPFFMLNSDIICEISFEEIINFHRVHGREGTICVTQVSDPSRYGLVISDPETHIIKEFVEKPTFSLTQLPHNYINAGIY